MYKMTLSVQSNLKFSPRSFLVVIVAKAWLPVIAKVLSDKLNMEYFGGGRFGKNSEYILLNFIERPEVIDKLVAIFGDIPHSIMIDNKGWI